MSDGLVRVMFELDGNTTERLWAEPVGAGRYRLRNTPFFAFGVSTEDIVFAEERSGLLCFTGVSIRAGHSTYRVKRTGHCGDDLWQARWEPLARLGCTYESGTVLAVDVPPSADIYAVYELLEGGVSAGAWDFDEGHCGHPLKPGPSAEGIQ